MQLAVKEAVVKLGIIIQNEDAYLQVHSTIANISNTYNPLINKYMPVLTDLQAELEPVEYRMMKLDQSLKTGVKLEYPVK